MTASRAPADAGFLLAETLITFALSALVLLGLVAATSVLLRATDRSVAMVGSTDDLGRTLASLRRDLSGLARARWNGDEPQFFVFRGGPNSLFFVSEGADAGGERERRAVSLREVATGQGTALMRAEAHLPASAAAWSDLRFGRQSILPTGMARLRFRYVAEATAEPAPPPVDAWPSGLALPAAVLVEVVDAASKRLIVTERIAIRTDGDIGCADRSAGKTSGGSTAQGKTAAPAGPAADGGTSFSLDTPSETANPNEFCGRLDKGVAPRPSTAFAGASR